MERLKAGARSVQQANHALRLLLAEIDSPAACVDSTFVLRRLAAIVGDMDDPLVRNAHQTMIPVDSSSEDLSAYAALLRRLQFVLSQWEVRLREKRSHILAEREALERASRWMAAQIGGR